MFDKVIEVKNLWVRYRSLRDWVLKGVDLDIYTNRVILIVGRSGSGKTTLVRSLTGAVKNIYGAEVKGSIKILGKDLEEYNVEDLRKVIQVVNQNPFSDFFNIAVEEDIYGIVHFYKVDPSFVEKVLEMFKVKNLMNRYLFELSGGQLRRLAIVKSLLFNPSVVVFDEPLMWLDDEGVDDFVESVKLLKKLGKGVVVFEHRFKPLLHVVDEVYAFKEGVLKLIDVEYLRSSKSYSPNALINNSNSSSATYNREKVVEVKNVWFGYQDVPVLKDLNLSIYSRETVIIYGRNGSGKSTLLKVLAGYIKPLKGVVKISRRAVYIPQNVYLFYTEETLGKEIESICGASKHGDKVKCYERVLDVITKELNIDKVELSRTPFSLSWGEAIRFAISLTRAVDPNSVVLLDEPFTGLTYYERLSLAKYLAKLGGTLVIAISNRDAIDYLFNAGLTPRILEISDGKLKEFSPTIGLDVIDLALKVRDFLYGGSNEHV